jgi:hypothetical protein
VTEDDEISVDETDSEKLEKTSVPEDVVEDARSEVVTEDGEATN